LETAQRLEVLAAHNLLGRSTQYLLGFIEPFVKDFVQQWADGKMGYITTWRIIPVTGRKW